MRLKIPVNGYKLIWHFAIVGLEVYRNISKKFANGKSQEKGGKL